MRFETSQTTPAFLDRRLQLRMLSFVGLIAVIMFTLSALNYRSATKDAGNQRQANVSPDSLNFEVHREELDLKPGEFVMPVAKDDGVRGQSPRLRSESTAEDRELFVPRSKERIRDDTSGDKLFRRRRSVPKPIEENAFHDGLATVDPVPFDEDPIPVAQPINEIDRMTPAETSTVDDDWNSEPIPTTRIGELEPIREPIRRQLPDEITPAPRRDFPKTSLLDDGPEPFRPNHVEASEIPPSRDEFNPRGDEIVRETLIPKRHPKKAPVASEFEQDQDLFDNQNRQPPIDLRRRDEFTRNNSFDEAQPTSNEVAAVRIDKRYLDVVKDNTIGVRRDEAEVFYWLLDHARRVPALSLQRASDHEVQYINLMTEPDRYRGEPVTIEGDLFRLYEFEAGRNQYGVTKVYEGWVFTGDSSHHPYRIVCTSLPNGIEPGENLRMPVRITGYFFKREGYRSNGGVHIAPTLLAKRVNINPMPNGIPLTSGILPYMTGAIMAFGLALLVTVVGFAIGDGRASRNEIQRLQRHPQPSFVGIHLPEIISVEESLRQLAEQERELAVGGAYGPLFSKQMTLEHAVHDYSKSHQALNEETQRQHRKQTGTLQSWAARKQAAQAEIEALRNAQAERQVGSDSLADELNSDMLDPARNVLVRPRDLEQPHGTRAVSTNHEIPPTKLTRSGPSSTSTVPPVAAVPQAPNHIAHEANRLSEYEEEIARLTGLQTEIRAINPFSDEESEKAIASQIVEGQFQLEELDHQETVDNLDQENPSDHHHAFDRADRETVSFSLPPSSRLGQARHDNQTDDSDIADMSDIPNADESIDDSNADAGENSTEFRRTRRNRRDWRKGKTA